jgi:glycosyltransferase involved in cell wall biosynthesis
MKITVILCTYNRCSQLANVLECINDQRLPESVRWEILVVDNNSRDETRKVVESFLDRHPGRFRYLFEAQQGKSYALNAGIREASGDILAFIDDDVIVEPMWLQNLTAALNTDGWVGTGGRILPERAFSLPAWLSLDGEQANGPLVIFNLGDAACELETAPFGTNMAFQKKMFEKYGGFRADLGPCPGTEIRGEDSEFGNRLLSKGERLRYEPSAIVYHSVPKERIRRKYFLAWWYDKGRAEVREFGMFPFSTRQAVRGIPLCLFPRLAVWALRWMINIQPARRFSCKMNVWNLAGKIVEFHRAAKARKSVGGNAAL